MCQFNEQINHLTRAQKNIVFLHQIKNNVWEN
jgi:hypothetical protein